MFEASSVWRQKDCTCCFSFAFPNGFAKRLLLTFYTELNELNYLLDEASDMKLLVTPHTLTMSLSMPIRMLCETPPSRWSVGMWMC